MFGRSESTNYLEENLRNLQTTIDMLLCLGLRTNVQ